MVDVEIKSIRDKITHSMFKTVMPMAVHYAYNMFKLEGNGVLVKKAGDLRDTPHKFYIDHYYKLFNAVLDGWVNEKGECMIAPDHTIRKALEIGFTILDSDEAYARKLKDLYELERQHFQEGKKFD